MQYLKLAISRKVKAKKFELGESFPPTSLSSVTRNRSVRFLFLHYRDNFWNARPLTNVPSNQSSRLIRNPRNFVTFQWVFSFTHYSRIAKTKTSSTVFDEFFASERDRTSDTEYTLCTGEKRSH